MTDLIDLLGRVQGNGGILILLMYLVFEVRTIKHDFAQHEKIFHSPIGAAKNGR